VPQIIFNTKPIIGRGSIMPYVAILNGEPINLCASNSQLFKMEFICELGENNLSFDLIQPKENYNHDLSVIIGRSKNEIFEHTVTPENATTLNIKFNYTGGVRNKFNFPPHKINNEAMLKCYLSDLIHDFNNNNCEEFIEKYFLNIKKLHGHDFKKAIKYFSDNFSSQTIQKNYEDLYFYFGTTRLVVMPKFIPSQTEDPKYLFKGSNGTMFGDNMYGVFEDRLIPFV
jgi:hypothetical protein